jgi:hypothetical protein
MVDFRKLMFCFPKARPRNDETATNEPGNLPRRNDAIPLQSLTRPQATYQGSQGDVQTAPIKIENVDID